MFKLFFPVFFLLYNSSWLVPNNFLCFSHNITLASVNKDYILFIFLFLFAYVLSFLRVSISTSVFTILFLVKSGNIDQFCFFKKNINVVFGLANKISLYHPPLILVALISILTVILLKKINHFRSLNMWFILALLLSFLAIFLGSY